MICQVNDGLEGRMIITTGSWMKCRSNAGLVDGFLGGSVMTTDSVLLVGGLSTPLATSDLGQARRGAVVFSPTINCIRRDRVRSDRILMTMHIECHVGSMITTWLGCMGAIEPESREARNA
jgi:hypothetical protein